ncbi:MAG: diaminopimelate decarboxylase [Firmicutes bacterium]|nr:diaminopimelate decarboxylase [Bacillota bacterium]
MSCASANSRGHLVIGGCDAVALAKRFGTPLHVIDEDAVRRACRSYVQEFGARYPHVRIVYAGKALMVKAIALLVMEEGLSLDVCSGGELYTAISAGCPADHIYFHGNSKTAAEVSFALSVGVFRFIADSLDELYLIDRLAHSKGLVANVMLRLTPGIEAHTHDYIKTGQIDSKFGIVIPNGDALHAVGIAKGLANVRLTGLHCHIGSQVFEMEPFVDAVDIMMDFARQAHEATGFVMEELNIGGGLGIRYNSKDDPITARDLAEAVAPALIDAASRYGLPLPSLLLEPGRSIVGEAGTTLYTVNAVKRIEGVRTYVSVDGGMADNPRVALYQAEYEAALANRMAVGGHDGLDSLENPANPASPANPATSEGWDTVSVAGNCCESGDMLVWDIAMPRPEVGDTLAVFCTGAYNYSMASNYNRYPRPAVVLVHDGRADVIVERETYTDLVAHDLVPARLRPASARPAAAGSAHLDSAGAQSR